MDQELLNLFGHARISDRQLDELIGLAKGLTADGLVNQSEAEFLQAWLAANVAVSGDKTLGLLYRRVAEMLSDGVLDADEQNDLLDTLSFFSSDRIEVGEIQKPSSLPYTRPAPALTFPDVRFCFTGTFEFGSRRDCEAAVADRGGVAGSLTAETHFLVVGSYATESWKHSSFGNKISKAVDMQLKGLPIAIVAENHWASYL
ncbi:BRCT domain-containing protein [Devosia sp.]|uniref:BRCT domain-containing protein n=1 Tax=Devosia sp. TaxID=1871048 RepID=UPI002EE903AC